MIHRVECRMEEGVGSGGGGESEFAGCDRSKGTIRFPVDKPSQATLVKKLVKARAAEYERKKRRSMGLSWGAVHGSKAEGGTWRDRTSGRPG
jgi:hypothetical protein